MEKFNDKYRELLNQPLNRLINAYGAGEPTEELKKEAVIAMKKSLDEKKF